MQVLTCPPKRGNSISRAIPSQRSKVCSQSPHSRNTGLTAGRCGSSLGRGSNLRKRPNKSLELTPSVRALECLVTSVGIWSGIESSWERSSAPSR
jgi:hypothetical protein